MSYDPWQHILNARAQARILRWMGERRVADTIDELADIIERLLRKEA